MASEMCYSAATPPKKAAGRLVVLTQADPNHQPFPRKANDMSTHTSASAPEETPHETETTTISDALRRRAQSLINDKSIDLQWRTIIRFALELNDGWLSELVPRAEAGENILDTFESLRTPETREADLTEDKIKALAEIICHAGDEPAAALFVLMGRLENSTDPMAVANTAKHVVFTHCGELNLYGVVDAQIAVIEAKLLASNALVS
jgi:hypothetical protein